MYGRRTGIYIDKQRVISTDRFGITLWLTNSNLRKFKSRPKLNIFVGHNDHEDWIKIGMFILIKVSSKRMLRKGLTYVECRLKKIEED